MNIGGRSNNNSNSGSGGSSTPPADASGSFPDDGSRRMPIANSLGALEAGRRARAAIIARSGRASTRLAAGTASYSNTSVGGLN
jgi:hypothetical protein